MKNTLALLFIFSLSFISSLTHAQAPKGAAKVVVGIPVNYNEDSVGTYTLPDLFKMNDGKIVTTKQQWLKERRPEIVSLFEEYQYGKMPGRPADMHFVIREKGTPAMDGKAIRKQVTVYFSKDTVHKMDLLIYLPAAAKKPVPLLQYISFTANCNMIDDPAVPETEAWTKVGKKVPAKSFKFPNNLNFRQFIDAGFGIATLYYGDIEPDFKEGIHYGIRSVYMNKDEEQRDNDEWGTISAWAWGLSRAMDYYETDKQVDAKKIALCGVSRLGKTVLWAGAHDTRFAMVIASCSGEGGAAIGRRNYGENIKHMSHPARYGYQFAPNYHRYADSIDKFPVDAHMLVALMAPRPLLLQTGNTDYWSDPKGEFLAALAATPVYHLFGKKGMENDTWPKAGEPVLDTLGYTMHDGGHGTVPDDWNIFIEFMKKYL